MLTANVDQWRGLVNGQVGIVEKIPNRKAVYVRFNDQRLGTKAIRITDYLFKSAVVGLGTCIRTQIPLRVAWAITHHRSQGKTLQQVEVDPNSFSSGQAYVALSRSRNTDTLSLLKPAQARDFKRNEHTIRFERLRSENASSDVMREAVGTWHHLPQGRWQSRSAWPRAS